MNSQSSTRPRREAPVTVRLDKALRQKLAERSLQEDIPVSQLIRRALKRELDSTLKQASKA